MMCISLRYFFPSQLFQATDQQIQRVPVMRKGSFTRRNSSISSTDSDTESYQEPTPEDEESHASRISSISSTDSSLSYLSRDEPSTSSGPPCRRKSSLRRGSTDSRECRRVSFHDQVNVRVYPIDEPQGFRGTPVVPPPVQQAIDDIDSLTEEVSSRLSTIKAKDAPIPSLEELCDSITDVNSVNPELVDTSQATTSRNRNPSGYSYPPEDFERDYAEMDLIMRLKYPKYYHFLRSHMVTGVVDTEEYRSQEMEFKEAIVGSRQYPAEYFQDLENTLSYYERMSSGPNTD